MTVWYDQVERIAKALGASFGSVLNVFLGRCREGTVRILPREGTSSLVREPWGITYRSFAGTLPSIRSLGLEFRGVEALIADSVGLFRCLYKGRGASQIEGSTIGGLRFEGISFNGTRSIPLQTDLGGAFACPRAGFLSGTLRLERALELRLA
jgi:hypothetical protein